jgi:hypothetical protein
MAAKEGFKLKLDGFVKSPISALRFIPRHCGVPEVRLIPRDSQALISNILRSRLKLYFLRDHQTSSSGNFKKFAMYQ